MNTKLTFVISIFLLLFLMSAASANENTTDIAQISDDEILQEDLQVEDVLHDDSSAENTNNSRLNTEIVEDSIQGEAGDSLNVYFEILDENDNPVMNGTASLIIGDYNYTSEVSNGTAVFKGVLIEEGMKTATVYYHGNEWYNSTQREILVYVIHESYLDIPIYEESVDDISTPLFEEPQKKQHNVVKAVSESNPTGNPIFLIWLSLMVILSNGVINRKR